MDEKWQPKASDSIPGIGIQDAPELRRSRYNFRGYSQHLMYCGQMRP